MTNKIILDTSLNKMYEKISEVTNVNSYVNLYIEVIDKKVTGWYYPIDMIIMFHIAKIAQENINGDFCELGVAFGKSAIGLSILKKEEEKLYLYDFFNSDEISQENATSVIEKYGNYKNVEWRIIDLYKLNREEIAFANQLRLLHIDSCHQHTMVLKDLSNFTPHIIDDGVICIDDFNDPEYPGVNTAIAEFINSEEGKDWRIFAIGANKAYLCRKKYFDFYRNSLVRWIRENVQQINVNFAEVFDKECALLIGAGRGLSEEEIENILENKKERFYG